MNAPLTWPNSSLSKIPSGRPPVLTVIRGLDARPETAWSACATTPFPVPFSPVMMTFASEGPMRSINSSTGRMEGASAISVGRPSARNSRFSASRRCPRRSAWPSSICVRRMVSRRAFSQGFWTKSRAPRRMASTATSTLPQAVITITGSVLSRVWRRHSRSSPSWPEVVSRA